MSSSLCRKCIRLWQPCVHVTMVRALGQQTTMLLKGRMSKLLALVIIALMAVQLIRPFGLLAQTAAHSLEARCGGSGGDLGDGAGQSLAVGSLAQHCLQNLLRPRLVAGFRTRKPDGSSTGSRVAARRSRQSRAPIALIAPARISRILPSKGGSAGTQSRRKTRTMRVSAICPQRIEQPAESS